MSTYPELRSGCLALSELSVTRGVGAMPRRECFNGAASASYVLPTLLTVTTSRSS